jgi:hypothetical protein
VRQEKLKIENPMDNWPEFAEAVRRRMEKGRKNYGDASFFRPPEELAREVEEELLDVAGWSFILWTRLRALENKISAGGLALRIKTPERRGYDILRKSFPRVTRHGKRAGA